MGRVYIETSFVSACVSDRADAGSRYRREASLKWWRSEAKRHELFVSLEVILELSVPRFRRSKQAIDLIREVPALPIDDEVIGVATVLVQERVMPGPLRGDAVHVAVASVHAIDWMLSWNVRHLANPNKAAHLLVVCRRLGLGAPTIVTPDALWETA